MRRKKIIIAIVIGVLVLAVVYQFFIKEEKPNFTLAEVGRGNIVQEVSETGQVQEGEEINLSFQNSGALKEIYVKVGDEVESGQHLAKLDTSQLAIQLSQARAALEVIEAQKDNAQISLESARQKLEDTRATANEKLGKAYKDALNILDDAYLKIYNSDNYIGLLKRTYFDRGDSQSMAILEDKIEIEKALDSAKFYINQAKNSSNNEDIDIALEKVAEALLKTKAALEEARNMAETVAYREIVSTTDKNTLDTHSLNINTAYSNLVSSQATISLTKITNQADINSVKAQVATLESQLQENQGGLYQAQINQAQAQIQLLENQIEDSYLKSPTSGQITKINKKIGEVVQPLSQDAVISLLPSSPFEIEVNIYEGDIVKIKVGDEVEISFIAFPDKIFKGKVITIDPAEKILEGVIYYEVKIIFDEEIPQDLKTGMSADVKIITASKENVLVVPEGAIEKKDGKKFIEILKGKKSEEREIETGLEGSNGLVEIISGVAEGEKVIIR